MTRKCGDCTLCCKLTPVVELRKPGPSFLKLANHKCSFQSRKGCSIYDDIRQRPRACFIWRCRWLKGDEGTENLPRPDRAGYVIDEAPDMISMRNEATGEITNRPAIQIWVGPRTGNQRLPPSLKRYMEHMGTKGYGIILRYDEKHAMVNAIWDGSWKHQAHEANITHAPEDIAQVWREHGLA